MIKSYPDQLAEWVKQRKCKRRDETLVEFLAVRHDVKSGMDAGYSAKTVWMHMQESKRVSFGYDTFLKFVRRFFPGSTDRLRRHPAPAGLPSSGKAVKQTHSVEGFTFNPDPKKEELL